MYLRVLLALRGITIIITLSQPIITLYHKEKQLILGI